MYLVKLQVLYNLDAYLDTQNDKKLDAADLRGLWKKAINQQVLLIRMEKENAKLKGSLKILNFILILKSILYELI